MKGLRSVTYVIVAIFLGIFINLFSVSLVLKNVVQDEMITNIVKSTIANEYLTKNIKNLSEEEQKIVKDFLDDNQSNEVVNIILNNYMNYQSNPNYKISQKDVDTIKKYIESHQDVIKKVSKEEININDITKELTVENIDNKTRETVKKLDQLPPVVETVVKTYKEIVTGPIKLILGFMCITCIGLLMLISWSLIKWMKATGICLIVNGVLITLMYVIVMTLKDVIINNIDAGIFIQNITFNNILIIGMVELIGGIALVITHKVINNKIKDSNELPKQEETNTKKDELVTDEQKSGEE